jgi:Tat protein translocase TatB subunit
VFNLGFGELAVVLVVALIFLGPKMLPEIASGLGKVIREIRKATADIKQDIELDDMIRGPLRELRDAATLPPDELKRRDAAKVALRKVEEEAAQKKQREAAEAEAAKRQAQAAETKLAAAPAAAPAGPADVISAGGTMIASPPPTDDVRTLTPLPELHSPPPVVTAPPPRLPTPPLPPPPPRPAAGDATVIDVHAQLKATTAANTTLAGRPVLSPPPPPPKPPVDRKG